MPWDTVIYKRDELYAEVWAMPLRYVASKHGISDVALAKICKKLDVPRPGRGYWARKQAGKHVEPTPLPPLQPTQRTQLARSRWRDPIAELGPSPEFKPLLLREVEPSMAIAVPRTLTRPHEWVLKSKAQLQKHWKSPHLALTTGPCLDICVSRQVLGRALVLADTLLKALDHRGFGIEVSNPRPGTAHRTGNAEQTLPSTTGVRILGTLVRFGLVERYDSVKFQPKPRRMHPKGSLYTPPAEYRRHPNGRLALEIHSPIQGGVRRTWCDGKRQRVENCLNEFLVALIQTAERHRISEAARAQREDEWAQARQEREQRALREELERKKVELLDRRVAEWVHGQNVLAFVDSLEAGRTRSGEHREPDTEQVEWLSWARRRGNALIDQAHLGGLPLEESPHSGLPGLQGDSD